MGPCTEPLANAAYADASEGAGEDVPAGPAETLAKPGRGWGWACVAQERLSMHAQSWPRLGLGLVLKPKIENVSFRSSQRPTSLSRNQRS